MEIYRFQNLISSSIAEKYLEYMNEPLFRTHDEMVPFFYNLSAITGAGKTLILADAITRMRIALSAEPIVLWISKGKVVVSQTLNNLSAGKYSEFIPGFSVLPLLDCKQENIEATDTPLLLVATVGKFNQKDMGGGDRIVYRVNLDNADLSLWDMIKERPTSNRQRRPLFIIYDEGHNLSNQQSELLLQLKPDVILSASATMRVPDTLYKKVIQRIIDDKGWDTGDFSIKVKSSDVVNSGLIKKHIAFGGYVSPMEIAIDELISNFQELKKYIKDNNIGINPKAIYVSNTNIVTETGNKDNHLLPFEERHSSPIRIWRHLVENNNIDPNDIAIYCDLKVDPRFPLPEKFHLFSGGENDYERFIAEEYHHIIFNLSLQEGWDDPSCYFAYIDKDMGSKDQVTQVIGRVLRQPDSQHYSYPDLNTAHVYVRTDSKNVIDDVIEEIQKQLVSETPEVTLSIYKGKSLDKTDNKITPRKSVKLPLTTIDAKNAMDPIKNIINTIPDFRGDQVNTVGTGSRIKIFQNIGTDGTVKNEWVEIKHTNRITARWLLKREMQKYFTKVSNLCDTEDVIFDALVEYSSKAAEWIKEKAEAVVNAYIEHSIIIQDAANTFIVPSIYVDPHKCYTFDHSLHEKYSDFNQFELDFALELDKSKKTWFRNPRQGCFSIPLLDKGGTNSFNPDFIIWSNNKILAIDTKGDHLIQGDAARKLFTLKKYGKGPDLIVKLVTKGEWSNEIKKIGANGYTIWGFKNGKIINHHEHSLKNCINSCLNTN